MDAAAKSDNIEMTSNELKQRIQLTVVLRESHQLALHHHVLRCDPAEGDLEVQRARLTWDADPGLRNAAINTR